MAHDYLQKPEKGSHLPGSRVGKLLFRSGAGGVVETYGRQWPSQLRTPNGPAAGGSQRLCVGQDAKGEYLLGVPRGRCGAVEDSHSQTICIVPADPYVERRVVGIQDAVLNLEVVTLGGETNSKFPRVHRLEIVLGSHDEIRGGLDVRRESPDCQLLP